MKFIEINKSKGFTLIEVMLVVGIISIFTGGVLLESRKSIDYLNRVEAESCKNNILAFINNGKLYCRNKAATGVIVFDTSNNQIRFQTGVKLISKLTLPKDFKLKNVEVHDGVNSIKVDKFGFISDACTISFTDKSNKKSDITICVGTGFCDIK